MYKKTQIIDNNGAVVSERSSPFKAMLNNDGYKVPIHKLGAKIFADVKFPETLTHADIGRMTCLSKLMIGKTNFLGYRKGREIEAYTEKELTDFIKLKDRQGRQFIKKMCSLHIMRKTETGYYINPLYYLTGQRLTLDLFLIFRDELKNFLPLWVIAEFLRQAKEKQGGDYIGKANEADTRTSGEDS